MVSILEGILRSVGLASGAVRQAAVSAPEDRALVELIQLKVARLRREFQPNVHLEKARFLVFDTETTGLHPYAGDEIVSIGAVAVENGGIRTERAFERFCCPSRELTPESARLTGLTRAGLSGFPGILEILPEFLNLGSGRVLVAHNAGFDLAFLKVLLRRRCGIRTDLPAIDTLALARALRPTIERPTLEYLAESYGVPLKGRHTAAGDAQSTAGIFLAQLEEVKERHISTVLGLMNLIKSIPD